MGKSFLATQLAERINVPNVLQTNLVYEFLNSVKYRSFIMITVLFNSLWCLLIHSYASGALHLSRSYIVASSLNRNSCTTSVQTAKSCEMVQRCHRFPRFPPLPC